MVPNVRIATNYMEAVSNTIKEDDRQLTQALEQLFAKAGALLTGANFKFPMIIQLCAEYGVEYDHTMGGEQGPNSACEEKQSLGPPNSRHFSTALTRIMGMTFRIYVGKSARKQRPREDHLHPPTRARKGY